MVAQNVSLLPIVPPDTPPAELLDWLNINPDVKRLSNASTVANNTAVPGNATDDFIAAEAQRVTAAGGGEDGDDRVAAEAKTAAAAQEAGDGQGAGREEL